MSGDQTTRAETRTPLLEWLAAGVGAVLVLLVVGVLVRDGLTAAGGTDLEVRAAEVTAVAGGWRQEIEVVNHGHETGAAVQVEGELRVGAEVETSEATLAYAPGEAKTKGGLFFRSDPRAGQLALRAKGYADP